MKNQYFGDKTDYLTYGLLRTLTGSSILSLAVCWMRTPDDGRTDGRFLGYLDRSEQWRRYDPELFDILHETVRVQGRREVGIASEIGLLPAASFYDPILPDDAAGRERYFESFWQLAGTCGLVFFDPDNGLEVKSRPYGLKGSSKYLYWHELITAADRGYPVLLFQHFRRVRRQFFIELMAGEIADRTGCEVVYAFRTARVVFFLLLLEGQEGLFLEVVEKVRRIWSDHIQVLRYQK